MRGLIIAVAALVAAAPASSAGRAGLHGIVRVPLPVCMQDEPCGRGAAGVQLAFWRAGKVAARVTSGVGGRYRITLAPGAYSVSSPSTMIPRKGVSPERVRVLDGAFRTVDFFVDTGIR